MLVEYSAKYVYQSALLNVSTLLQQANPRGPEFSTTYKSTEQTIKVKFTALEVLLHQEAILSIVAFAQNLVPPPKPAQETVVAETTTGKKQQNQKMQQPLPGGKRLQLRDVSEHWPASITHGFLWI